MTEKNGIRIDAIVVGEAEDARIEFLVRYMGKQIAVISLGAILRNQLDFSKDYDEDKLNFIRCLINEGHRLHENK